eukprot:11224629-Lingulodinium_polyedra.AAC.1
MSSASCQAPTKSIRQLSGRPQASSSRGTRPTSSRSSVLVGFFGARARTAGLLPALTMPRRARRSRCRVARGRNSATRAR